MAALLVGYARCSTDQQDLTTQRDGLTALGVGAARVYVDFGLTGTNRERPGLREALAACREGDALMITKLNRLGGGVAAVLLWLSWIVSCSGAGRPTHRRAYRACACRLRHRFNSLRNRH